MSVADKLQTLTENISDAYDAIDTKGGTIPQDKNTENLADAITSIPAGGGDPEFFGCTEGIAEMNYLEDIMPELLTFNYGGFQYGSRF